MDKNKVDFDYFAENYNNTIIKASKFISKSNFDYFAYYKIKRLKSVIDFKPLKILDYGCGIGNLIPEIKKNFPHSEIYGYEVSKKSLEVALSRFSYLKTFNKNDKYDLIIFCGVFHHCSENEQEEIFNSLRNITNENSKLVVFEHNPKNYITRRIVKNCELDKDAVLIDLKSLVNKFENENYECEKYEFIFFVPPLLRIINFIEYFLKKIPFGCQYFTIYKKNKSINDNK
tara:strand:- start:475 stop:1164 length:690 start_codon:yes stop_codon:yes gene_type:complete